MDKRIWQFRHKITRTTKWLVTSFLIVLMTTTWSVAKSTFFSFFEFSLELLNTINRDPVVRSPWSNKPRTRPSENFGTEPKIRTIWANFTVSQLYRMLIDLFSVAFFVELNSISQLRECGQCVPIVYLTKSLVNQRFFRQLIPTISNTFQRPENATLWGSLPRYAVIR